MDGHGSTDEERDAVVALLASHGSTLLPFADIVAAGDSRDLYVDHVGGPLSEELLQMYRLRAQAVEWGGRGKIAIVGLDRLAELVESQEHGRFWSVLYTRDGRTVTSLTMLHDGTRLVAAVAYDGSPIPAVPAG
jgi:hypothetical protein